MSIENTSDQLFIGSLPPNQDFNSLRRNVRSLNEGSTFGHNAWSFYNPRDLGELFFGENTGKADLMLFDPMNLFKDKHLVDSPFIINKNKIRLAIYTSDDPVFLQEKFTLLSPFSYELSAFILKKEDTATITLKMASVLLGHTVFTSASSQEANTWTTDSSFKNLQQLSVESFIALLAEQKSVFKDSTISASASTAKKRVHFTIGMFFDGTGNNRFNSEFNYYKYVNSANKRLNGKQIPQEATAMVNDEKTITIKSDDSYWNPYSNIALLHDLYKEENMGVKNDNGEIYITLKQYVQGIGTVYKEKDDLLGSAMAEGPNGIIGKVLEGCNDLAEQIKLILGNNYVIGSLKFDVFGFSRGAAAARHFCNELYAFDDVMQYSSHTSTYARSVSDHTTVAMPNKMIPTGKRKYNLGILGTVFSAKDIPFRIFAENDKQFKNYVNVRYLGVFDTVVSEFLIEKKVDNKLLSISEVLPNSAIDSILYYAGKFIETKLDVVQQKLDDLDIDYIVHLTAGDEWRRNFKLTRVGKGFEMQLPGSHSDIGGGYSALLENRDIVDYAEVNYPSGMSEPSAEYNRLLELKEYYVKKGYCNPKTDTIEIKKEKEFTIELKESSYTHKLYKLIITRKLLPRYSAVSLHLMKSLAQAAGIEFKKPEQSDNLSKFEYEIPKELKKYTENMCKNALIAFEKYKKNANKKVSYTNDKPLYLPKNKYIHLSATFNSPIINIKGFGRTIDEYFYVNAPKYKDEKKNSYEREEYTNFGN